MWLWILLGAFAGFIAGAIHAVKRSASKATWVAFRHSRAKRDGGSPYRGDATANATPGLGDLVAAARTAGLDVRETKSGFDVRDKNGKVVNVRVTDPARVSIESIDVIDGGTETVGFQIALAFVPIYGPIDVTEAMWGTFLADGSRDAEALREQRGERIRDMARGIQERLAASQPMWDKLGEKL